jgi:hypothetical protein
VTPHRLTATRRVVALLVLSTLLLAACGGGDSDEDSAVTQTSTTTTEPTTTTTEAPTTTTEPAPAPTFPLTGLPLDGADPEHPALVVKIDNHPDSRPQWGLNQADIVYEEIVEGRITRFAAVFHSQDSDPVGPIRSARTSDFDILTQLNTPLFANSGGNENVLNMLNSVDAQSVNVNAEPDLYYRESSRPRPHNLMANTSELMAAAGEEAGTPPQLFEYRTPDAPLPANAMPIDGIDIDYGGTQIEYRWDPATGGWQRAQNGTPHVDVDDVQIAPENVVVQFISYGRSPADAGSPEAELIGEGDVWVLTDGHLIEGTWHRPDEESPTTLTVGDETIALTPGSTWVALPRLDMATVVNGSSVTETSVSDDG